MQDIQGPQITWLFMRQSIRIHTLHRASRRGWHIVLCWQRRYSHVNTLAGTINGLSKAGFIRWQSGLSRGIGEIATLQWVDWFNHQRLPGSVGQIPSA
jgi:hypothetical protein